MTIIGYQIANSEGENIQGDDGDPSGFASYEVLSLDIAAAVIRSNVEARLTLQPVHDHDIENPVAVTATPWWMTPA